jgi:gamma-glutamyltranspeptidase / glutathione hydrolase
VYRVREMLTRFPSSRQVFFPNGAALPTGSVWKQPDLAWSLQQVQQRGVDGFYRGALAQRLASSIQKHGGIMTTEDLADYKAIWRTPVSGTYRGYQIFSMPPPSSGGIHVIQALNVLEGYDVADAGHNSALNLHRLTETLRQCYADRSEWLGDPAYFKVPTEWLISKTYAQKIRSQIPERRARTSASVKPGTPVAVESPQTTHLCTMDENGWAVSLTYTLNFSYGSGLVADNTGILLNNEMEDFVAVPNQPNAFGLLGGKANAVEPGKRPLSSMTPTIVQRNGQLIAALGSPGGSRIITVVLQVLMNLIDYDLNSQTAVADPRIHHQWYPDQVEVEQGFSRDTLDLLRSWGHKVVQVDSLGHAMMIRRLPDGRLEVGADPRRTGGHASGH